MTTTTRPTAPTAAKTPRIGAAEYRTVSSPSPVVPAPRLRRRPALVAMSFAAVCLGALLGVWTWSSTSNTHEVVALRQDVARGETVTQADLITVQVGVDPALTTVPGADLAGLVGQRAVRDMAAGSLVTPNSVSTAVLPEQGMSVVGVALPPSLMPGLQLLAGDHVRVVATPGQQGEVGQDPPPTISAAVVGLSPDGENGQTVVSLEVPEAQAAELAARAATGNVALVLDSRER